MSVKEAVGERSDQELRTECDTAVCAGRAAGRVMKALPTQTRE